MGGLGGTPPIKKKEEKKMIYSSSLFGICFYLFIFLKSKWGFGGYPPPPIRKKNDLHLFQFLMLFLEFIFYLLPISGNTLQKKKKKKEGHTLPL